MPPVHKRLHIHALFSPRLADKLEEKLIAHYGYGPRVPTLGLREAEDPDLRFLADYVYRNRREELEA